MDSALTDLLYALRTLAKTRGFTVAAIVALALGIGANTAIFSVVNAVVLRPLPYHDPDRIVRLYESNPGQNVPFFSASPPNYLDWKTATQAFEAIEAFTREQEMSLTGMGEPEQLLGSRVSAGVFSLLGVGPAIGRTFRAEEANAGANRVVIVGHGLWQRRLGGNPDLVGRTLTLDGQSHTVVGIMAAGFGLPNNDAELWIPLSFDDEAMDRGNHFLRVIGRVRAGIPLQQAEAELRSVARALEREYPETNAGWTIAARTLQDVVIGQQFRQALLVLLGAVGCVLLIACANVANLMLARTAARQRELAVRAALGASRARLVRQILTESAALGVAGGIVGLLVASWGIDLLLTMSPDVIPRLGEVRIDRATLGFTGLISVLSGLLFGFVPALRHSAARFATALREGTRGSSGRVGRDRMRSLLIVSETALASMLLIGGGLLIRSFWNLQSVNPGFTAERVATLRIALPVTRYPDDGQVVRFYERLVDQAAALPGVERAAMSSIIPLGGRNSGNTFVIEGRPPSPDGRRDAADFRVVTPGYFRTLQIPIVRGRDFSRADGADSESVAIIDATMASQFWPAADPIGKRIRFGGPQGPWRTIVGIVGPVRNLALDEQERATIYLALPQAPQFARSMTLVARSVLDPAALAGAFRTQVRGLDPDLPVSEVGTMERQLADSLARRRFSLILLVTFALLALVLASVGVYGVVAHSVSQRTHEIGMRIALGAARSDIARLILGQGMSVVLLGVCAGIAGALALSRVLATLLFDVTPTDPVAFAGVGFLLTTVALVACYLPARRAMRIDPMAALREE